jgi:hypothetical protein
MKRKIRTEIYGPRQESATEIYGRLSVGWERKLMLLKWLLQEDRWRDLGFADINAFLGSIGLDALLNHLPAKKYNQDAPDRDRAQTS